MEEHFWPRNSNVSFYMNELRAGNYATNLTFRGLTRQRLRRRGKEFFSLDFHADLICERSTAVNAFMTGSGRKATNFFGCNFFAKTSSKDVSHSKKFLGSLLGRGERREKVEIVYFRWHSDEGHDNDKNGMLMETFGRKERESKNLAKEGLFWKYFKKLLKF